MMSTRIRMSPRNPEENIFSRCQRRWRPGPGTNLKTGPSISCGVRSAETPALLLCSKCTWD
jgi:hypothetical protein